MKKINWTRATCNLVPHMPRKQNGGREEIVSGFSRQLNFQRHHLNQAKFSRWVYENNKLEHQFTTLHFT